MKLAGDNALHTCTQTNIYSMQAIHSVTKQFNENEPTKGKKKTSNDDKESI